MRHGWNISLFHYRNHGADYGRVLVGMQVPPGDQRAFKAFLEKLGYPYGRNAQSRVSLVLSLTRGSGARVANFTRATPVLQKTAGARSA